MSEDGCGDPSPSWIQVRGSEKAGWKLTGSGPERISRDPFEDDEFDRLVAGREIARVIARMLFDHEKRRAEQRARSDSAVEFEANR